MKLTDEEWMEVENYEGLYRINRVGDVWSYKRAKFKSHILLNGYPTVFLYKNKITKHAFVHRLLAFHFIPKIEGKNFVNHKDGNKQNNDLNNLEWCTYKENIMHAVRTGLRKAAQGAKQGNSKLTAEQVEGIYLKFHKDAKSIKELGSEYNLSVGHVNSIVYGNTWKHLGLKSKYGVTPRKGGVSKYQVNK